MTVNFKNKKCVLKIDSISSKFSNSCQMPHRKRYCVSSINKQYFEFNKSIFFLKMKNFTQMNIQFNFFARFVTIKKHCNARNICTIKTMINSQFFFSFIKCVLKSQWLSVLNARNFP